ncbi:MAG: UDP-N-acetylmuramoylalanine--D-glutamate ligase [Omnitrophica WOR_2 bacterium RIFCSPHIGHO2_02_FULL_45_21]|nr:MAG: UDP-N-acetylmuramoylalanine--D-glutamate ligase [Omnitrophica WOR_2 bacterium RIFCSPHIGHO2_02_FULL_45_21]OGX42203.1 MAG: UDP-N-acetylmuramoylalanine--D-glutamate ligase [Omnitrophica WOR_2 bacterium RIFCSPLOWO2_02_FULL_45_28]
MIGDYKGKKVTVVGLARSGYAAARLLKDIGSEVYVTDSADNDRVRTLAKDLKRQGIYVETGRHSLDFIRNKDLVVSSPGVSNKSQAFLWADQLKIPVISEIELSWSLCPATVIAISGTNGKTTVTTLLGKVLEAADRRVWTLGNIGKPFAQEVMNMNSDDFVSLEVSSFQLERITAFKPKVSAILNFTRDHLDRYGDMSEYLAAKKRIFRNQSRDDYLVLNYDQPILRNLAKESKAKVIFFSARLLPVRQAGKTQDARRCLNSNHYAVMAVAKIFAVPEARCMEAFRNFKGVEHRLEQVRTINGIEFINDSKATNVDSTVWALHTMLKPTILIAGGRDKNSDYRLISDLIKQKVKLIILIGEAREKIRTAFKGLLSIEEASSLEEATQKSFQRAQEGDCILLSPMCASFDMFSDYEHRGRVFKEIVGKLE